VISGAFSLTREAVQLDLLPRVRVQQTSEEAKGQIFVPAANMFLFVCVILFVLVFQSSAALTRPTGLAVLGTMICTTLLSVLVARSMWKWSWWRVAPCSACSSWSEMAFLAGSVTKIPTAAGFRWPSPR
jgi:KUP system potassium uptake protein